MILAVMVNLIESGDMKNLLSICGEDGRGRSVWEADEAVKEGKGCSRI